MPRRKSRTVVIVGAGLFGSIAAELCERNGFEVIVIDSREPRAGSKPAACLLKPSWMSALSRAEIDQGLELLDALYGLRLIEFTVNRLKKAQVYHVNPGRILLPSNRIVRDKVVAVGDGWVETKGGERYEGFVLVAAGIWSELLVPMQKQRALAGIALYFKGTVKPSITVWAPYKQVVAFNIGPKRIWFGDGTSIQHKNFDEQERLRQSTERAKKYVSLTSPYNWVVGYRPAIPKQLGYFEQVYKRTWVSSGGAKNGTIQAALQAQQFLECLE